MTTAIDSLRMQIVEALSAAWKDDPNEVARLAWRDQSVATLRDDIAKWELDSQDEALAAGFLLGVHYATSEIRGVLDASSSSVPKAVVHRHTVDLLGVAHQLMETTEEVPTR